MRKPSVIVIAGTVIAFIPIIAVVTLKIVTGDSTLSDYNFWYEYMGYFGTVLLSTFALYQTQKLSEENDKSQAKLEQYQKDLVTANERANEIAYIDEKLYVSELQYTTTTGRQKTDMNEHEVDRGASFNGEKTRTTVLKHAETSKIKYDLVGKIAKGTTLTRKTVVAILKGIRLDKIYMFKNNPEEFITKIIRLINEQKATMTVEHITYTESLEDLYDSTIFTAEKSIQSFDKAYHAEKAIQDYVFVDGISEQCVERRFAEDLDKADEVCVYAKLPKGFHIPTPVGNYSPDWAIAFHEGKVKHIFFIAETKGSMSSMDFRRIEEAKSKCAKKLFDKLSDDNVKYDVVDSYSTLLSKVMR